MRAGAKNQVSFSYSPAKLTALERALSTDRLAPYLDAAEGRQDEAFRLYERNCRLSAAFYTPLQALEVAVRNEIDRTLSDRFGENWIEGEGIVLEPRQSTDIFNAIGQVSKDDRGRDRNYNRGEIISELNFGFWVGLLGPGNEVELWRKALYRGFANRPKGTERKAVQGVLNSIRRLRNRIAHHCRIIHRDLPRDHDDIMNVIGWICPDTRQWAESLSSFNIDDIPVPQEALPLEGFPALDPIPPVSEDNEPRPTRDGRPRLTPNFTEDP